MKIVEKWLIMEFFKIFLELFGIVSHLPLKEEAKDEIISIVEGFINDINAMWNYYRNMNYSLAPEETTEFQFKLKGQQRRVNGYIEKCSIVKVCSKCKKEFPATSKHFYKDRSVKDGLRPDCIECHRLFQKKSYKEKARQPI